MRTTYRHCDECSHEFEVIFNDSGEPESADGHAPTEVDESGAVFKIDHTRSNGGPCEAWLIVETETED